MVVLIAPDRPCQRALGTAAIAMDENDIPGGGIPAMDDRREVAGRLHAAQEGADPDPRREAWLAQAATLRTSPASTR